MAREMKDSGIEWIGSIPKTWSVSKVSRFFNIQLGKMLQPEKKNDNDSFENYLCAANVGQNTLKLDNVKQMWFSEEEKDTLLIQKGDLLVVEGGDIASCDVVECDITDTYLQNALHRVRPLKNFDNRVLKYYLRTAKAEGYIDLICNKATIAHFSKEKFAALPYLVIPLTEQSRIAAFLDRKCAEVDRIAAETEKTIEEYKALKQSIITEAVTKGVRGKRPMKDSGIDWIGKIPEEWKTSRVGIHYTIILGKMVCSEQQSEEYTLEPYFCAANVHFNGISSTDELKKMWFSPSEKVSYKVKSGDLLVVEGGAGAGGSAIATDFSDDIYIQNSIMICRNKRFNDNRYLRYLLEFLVKSGYVDFVCNKATIPHFTKDKLANVPYPVMNDNEQQEIANYLDNKCAKINKLIISKQHLLTELESYKKSLIYEYVTGKKEAPVCL